LNETPLPRDPTHRSPEQIFFSTVIDHNPKHFQPFGCPVFVLDGPLQTAGGIQHKWKERSRVGVYLGTSASHNRNVALVLSLESGLVSPQFHVKHDPSFHTPQQEQWESSWQDKAGFRLPTNGITTKRPNTVNVTMATKKRAKLTGAATQTNKTLSFQREPEPLPTTNHEVQQASEEQPAQTAPEVVTHTRYGRRVKPNTKYATSAEVLGSEASISAHVAAVKDEVIMEVKGEILRMHTETISETDTHHSPH